VAGTRQIAALEPLGTTYKIRFPGALPYIITGMRLGVGRVLLGVVVAELMAANAGLGYLLRDSSETWDSPKLFVTGVAIAEWFGATEGLGYLVFFAGQTLNVPTLFVGVAAFALLGILGFELVRRFENYVTPWKKQAQGG